MLIAAAVLTKYRPQADVRFGSHSDGDRPPANPGTINNVHESQTLDSPLPTQAVCYPPA